MQRHPWLAIPLQLSSFPMSQPSAGAGPTAPKQVAQALDFLSEATEQVCEPALQRPVPS